jgi:hypothetical protein
MSMKKLSTGAVIAIIAAGIILTITTAGLISVTQVVPSSGNVITVNVGVYSDSSCTQNLTSINWGSFEPGETKSGIIYVKNIGTLPVNIHMTTASWNPTSANGPIALTWNKENTALNPGSQVTATLTLTVADDITDITNFSFDIIFTGTTE